MEIEKKIAGMRARLKKEVGEAIDEVGDVVSEIRRDYAELLACVSSDGDGLVRILAEVLYEDARVPRIVPAWALRWFLKKYIVKK